MGTASSIFSYKISIWLSVAISSLGFEYRYTIFKVVVKLQGTKHKFEKNWNRYNTYFWGSPEMQKYFMFYKMYYVHSRQIKLKSKTYSDKN